MSTFQFLEHIRAAKSSETISLFELLGRIQYNPKKKTIQHLHTLPVGTKEYVEIKERLPCIKPHGTFDGYCDTDHFKQFSGYIYFDLDSTVITKEELIARYGHLISIAGVSVGGRGLFFLVRVNQPEMVTPQNFLAVQNQIKSIYFSALNIDNNAKGITRNFIIPYDPTVYFNPDAVVKISSVEQKVQSKKGATGVIKKEKESVYDTCCTFIDIDQILPKMNWKTTVEVDEWNDRYILCEHDSIKAFFPQIIPDGSKHKVFRQLVNAVVYNNPSFTYDEVVSVVNYVNRFYTGSHPMKMNEMVYTVRSEFDRLKATKEFRGLKKKYVVVNPHLSKKERQKAGCEAWGEVRTNRSIHLITAALTQLKQDGIKPTQKRVEELLKGHLSMRTIKTYWKDLVKEESQVDAYEEYLRNRPKDTALTPTKYLRAYKLPDTAALTRSQVNSLDDKIEWLINNINEINDGEAKRMVNHLKQGEYDKFIDVVDLLQNVYS